MVLQTGNSPKRGVCVCAGAGGGFGSLGKPRAGSVLLLLLLRPAARPFLSRFCLGFASGPFWGGFGPFWGGFGGVRGLRGGNLGQGCPERLRIPSPRVFGRKPPPRAQNPPKMAQNDPSRGPPQAPTPRSPYHPTGGVIGTNMCLL